MGTMSYVEPNVSASDFFYWVKLSLHQPVVCISIMCRSKGFAFIGFTCKADAEKVSSRHVSSLFDNWVFVISAIRLLN